MTTKQISPARAAWLGAAATLGLMLTTLGTAAEIPVVAPEAAGLNATKLAEVDRFMQGQVDAKKIAGGIVIASHNGKVGFFQTYGKRNIEADEGMTPDTIFRIYSMSKAITTAAALKLYDEGKLGLDDPVSKYIPSFAKLQVATPDGLRAPQREMTVRDLMLHTAGLTYGDGPEALKKAYSEAKPFEGKNLEEMAERFAKVPLAYDPGTQWIYSASIDVLGRVVEVAAGEPLDVYLQQTIFTPLDMPDTAFNVPADKLARFAANYSRDGEKLKLIDAPAESKYAKTVTLFSGGGGLVGTARDYVRFLTMIQNGGELDGHRILKPETVKLMTTNQLPADVYPIRFGQEIRRGTGFGLGFSVCDEVTDWDKAGHVGEYGWGGAASTHYWSSPADKLIVVTLEQIMPYQWDTERGVKGLLYEAIQK